MKDYDKNKDQPYFKYWDVNNLNGWTVSKKLPLDNFKWVEEISEFNKDFIKSYNDETDKGYFLEGAVQYPANLRNFHNGLPFLPGRMKIEKMEKLVAN